MEILEDAGKSYLTPNIMLTSIFMIVGQSLKDMNLVKSWSDEVLICSNDKLEKPSESYVR